MVNPPLRRTEDVLALRAALAEGVIDIVATDHAPHPLEAKECAWQEAAFGMVGLESALSVVQAAVVDSGQLSWTDVARVLSRKPAEIGQLEGYDQPFTVGAAAHLTLIDPTARRSFGAEQLQGKSVNSPYLGRELPGRIVATLHRGVPTVLDGELRTPEEVAAGVAN
jgi:dihydroorotase